VLQLVFSRLFKDVEVVDTDDGEPQWQPAGLLEKDLVKKFKDKGYGHGSDRRKSAMFRD
jgi:hypothetical protein